MKWSKFYDQEWELFQFANEGEIFFIFTVHFKVVLLLKPFNGPRHRSETLWPCCYGTDWLTASVKLPPQPLLAGRQRGHPQPPPQFHLQSSNVASRRAENAWKWKNVSYDFPFRTVGHGWEKVRGRGGAEGVTWEMADWQMASQIKHSRGHGESSHATFACYYVELLLTPQQGINQGHMTHSTSQITARQNNENQPETKRGAGQQKGRFISVPQPQRQTCSVAAHNRDANFVSVSWSHMGSDYWGRIRSERKRGGGEREGGVWRTVCEALEQHMKTRREQNSKAGLWWSYSRSSSGGDLSHTRITDTSPLFHD